MIDLNATKLMPKTSKNMTITGEILELTRNVLAF
jgi:hypothetical protein